MKKKRFADGDLVKGTTNLRTRSDDEIGDTDRAGNYKPGSYAARQANGQKNLDAVKGFFNKMTGKSTDTVPAASATYEESPAAKYIRKSVGQESTVSRPSQSTISGSQVDSDKNYESEAAPTPARKLPITVQGDYTTKPDTTGTSVEEEVKKSVTKAQPKINAAVKAKKTKEAEAAKSKKTENPVSTNFGNLVNPYQKKDKPAPAKPTKSSDKGIGPYKVFAGPSDEEKQATYSKYAENRKKMGDTSSDSGSKNISDSDWAKSVRSSQSSSSDEKPLGKRIREALGSSYKKGGSVTSASRRGDGIAQRGKTRGKIY